MTTDGARPPGPPERPHVHFTPPQGWLNDPNGLVHVDGTFHLFYQHHPHDTTWGPMHWGHATTTDLLSWTHHPVALAPDERGEIYSGSAVIDTDDTAGLGPGTLVAVFTHHRDGVEEQSLAWSHDRGETFTKLPGPILEAPPGEVDFRDPRILRRGVPGPEWVMLLAVGPAVWLLGSDDLLGWVHTGTVAGIVPEGGVCETPELMRFDVDGSEIWLLVVAVGDGAPAGGSGVRAVVGHFDGATFTPTGEPFWVDHGPDFYAPQAWSDAPDGRRIWIAWMGNWHRLDARPTGTWQGQMSIPREVSLRRHGAGYRLAQVPVPELAHRRERSLEASGPDLAGLLGAPLRVAAPALDVVVAAAPGAVVEVSGRRSGGQVTVRLDGGRGEVLMTVPGTGTGEVTHRAPLGDPAAPGDDAAPVGLRIVLDVASVEVFAGAVALSARLPGAGGAWTVAVASTDDPSRIERVEVHALAAAAGAAPPPAPS